MISSWKVLQVWLLGWLYMVTLLLGSFTELCCFSSTLGIGCSFSSLYLAAHCHSFLAAFLSPLVTLLVSIMSALKADSARTVWLVFSSIKLQAWLLVQRDKLTASFRLLHMDSVSSGASSEVLRAVSSEVLMAASAGVLRAISAAEGWRAASSYLGDLVDASSEDCGVASAAEDWIWVPSGGELVGSFMLSVGSFTR
jgi:hypothetical protein